MTDRSALMALWVGFKRGWILANLYMLPPFLLCVVLWWMA